jgi:hypothetical protein
MALALGASDHHKHQQQGRRKVEVDHQGAVVADRGGDHPGATGPQHPTWVAAQHVVQLRSKLLVVLSGAPSPWQADPDGLDRGRVNSPAIVPISG